MITISNNQQLHQVLRQVFKVSIYFVNLQIKGIFQRESIAKSFCVFYFIRIFSKSQRQTDDEIKKQNRSISHLRLWNEFATSDTERRASTTKSTITIEHKRSKKY